MTITRVEVIDESGRVFIKGPMYGDDVVVTYHLQDDGRTLKVFISQNKKDAVKEEA